MNHFCSDMHHAAIRASSHWHYGTCSKQLVPWGLHGESNCLLIAKFACLCVYVITFDSTGRQTSVHLHFADTRRTGQNKGRYFDILIRKRSQMAGLYSHEYTGTLTVTFSHILISFHLVPSVMKKKKDRKGESSQSHSVNVTFFLLQKQARHTYLVILIRSVMYIAFCVLRYREMNGVSFEKRYL
jgi:hypothetical protein